MKPWPLTCADKQQSVIHYLQLQGVCFFYKHSKINSQLHIDDTLFVCFMKLKFDCGHSVPCLVKSNVHTI